MTIKIIKWIGQRQWYENKDGENKDWVFERSG